MTNPTAAPSPQQAVAEALRLAKDALEESHDDVVNTLNSYVDHPANERKRALIQGQIDAHDSAISAARAALAQGTQAAEPSDEQIAEACLNIVFSDYESIRDYDLAIASAVLALNGTQ